MLCEPEALNSNPNTNKKRKGVEGWKEGRKKEGGRRRRGQAGRETNSLFFVRNNSYLKSRD
jgi:hypothetical protein